MNREPDKVNVLGIEIDRLTMAEVLERARRAMANRESMFICTANVDHLMTLQRDAGLRRAYGLAAVVTADGAPVLWASRVLGRPIRERVTGADLAPALCGLAADAGGGVFLLGGPPDRAADTRRRMMARMPALRKLDVYSPPFGFENDPSEMDRIDREIASAAPDVLLIALGSPKQERWYAQRGAAHRIPVAIGCGAAVDFMAGRKRRAPLWMQRGGLEWLYRLIREPRRMWRRVLMKDPPFFRLVLRQRHRQRRGLPWVLPRDQGT